MPRPAVIRRGSGPRLSVWHRIRRHYERACHAYKLARRKARYRRRFDVPKEKTIAFVLGCQRSGTNMTLRTLALSLDVDIVEESDPRGFHDCRILAKEIRDVIVARSMAKCVIFKPICDSHRVRTLYEEHHDSRGIWVYRHYRDVANSTVAYWGDQPQTYIEDLLQGGGDWGVAQWNREGVTDECLSILREAVGDGLNPYGAAALFWYLRNRTFFEQTLDHHPATKLARYEYLVTCPAEQFGRLCEFLGVAASPEMAANVSTSSIRKREPPPLNHRIERLCGDMLERLEAVLARQTDAPVVIAEER